MPISRVPLSPDREECLFYHGVALFNAGEYFETHEVWEEIWRPLPAGEKKLFYYAMIQADVALEHFRRGNVVGVARLRRRYLPRFAALPAVCMGVDVRGFVAGLEGVLGPLLEAEPMPARGSFTLNPALAPRLETVANPFHGVADQ